MQAHPEQDELSPIPGPGELVWYSPDACRWYLAMVFRNNSGSTELDFPWGARDWAPTDRLMRFDAKTPWPIRTWAQLAEAYFGDDSSASTWGRREVIRFLAIHAITKIDLDEFQEDEMLISAESLPVDRRAIA